MKKSVQLSFLLFITSLLSAPVTLAETASPDTVYTGIYITSIHNIDFKQKEYSINLWLWLKYRNRDFDFAKNLELPNAKTFTTSFTTVDTTEDGKIYMLMKLECIMKDAWKIDKFPFDRQTLRLMIENSQFDSSSLVFGLDTVGENYGRFTLSGWTIDKDSFNLSVRNQAYYTAFGDKSYAKPYSAYSSFRVKIGIERSAMWTLFWKIFVGMYVAFLISLACFFIHAGSVEARFGLSVGALFAAVGNKYVIDSSLPDSTSPTLVDTLHGITLISILTVIVATIYALKLVKSNKVAEAHRFDKITSIFLFVLYVALNFYFIINATAS